jgi:hypothetical protein
MAGTITVGTLLSDLTSSNKITIGSGTTLDLASGSAGTITLDAADLTGALPAISGASLTSIPAGNLTGALPAISGASLTNLPGGGKVLQMVYTQSSSSTITTTSSSYVASGIQLSITPIETGSDIVIEFTSSHVDVRGGNSTRLVAKMYKDVSAWVEIAVIGHDTNSSETHGTLSFSQRTTGTAGTAIAFEPYFFSNVSSSVWLSQGGSYMMKIWEIGA